MVRELDGLPMRTYTVAKISKDSEKKRAGASLVSRQLWTQCELYEEESRMSTCANSAGTFANACRLQVFVRVGRACATHDRQA
eukprot:6248866-Amphidinium_carterae.1